ncbi:MAG: hypothetical protein KC619_13755 [Myxococcales bacterium]|nr:hypothetical protein [Myxococcales bacterium]
MKNATLSALLLLVLGGTWAGVAAAQADDETEGGAATSESADEATGDEAAPEEAAPEEPTAEPTEEPTEEIEAPVEEPVEEPPPVEETPTEAATTGLAAPAEGSDEGDTDAEATEEAAEGEGEEESAESEPPPWRNTFFNYTNQFTTNSLWRGAQLSYNPVWQMLFSVVPRWYPGTGGFLRANLGFSLEVTDTDSNALNREPLLNDIVIDYSHPINLGDGFMLMPAARLTIPVSRSSLAAQRYLNLGGQLTAIKIIPEAGNLTLALLGRYSYWFAGSNVTLTSDPQPDICPPAPATQTAGGGTIAPDASLTTCGQFGTTATARHVVLAGLSATMTPVGAFSINLSAFLFLTYGHDLAPAYVNVATSEAPLRIDDGSPTHWQNYTYISLSVAYQFTPWLNMSLGIQNSGNVAPVYDSSGNVYNPLFTPDTQLYLTATFTLDELFVEITGRGEENLTPEQRQRRQQGLAAAPGVGGSF